MEGALAKNNILWDGDWHRENYICKDNYSIFRGDDWIGFLSLELEQTCLFIHTLQLTSSAQGKIFGYRVFEWIEAKAKSMQCRQIGCRAFKNSPVISLYERMGFKIINIDGVLCEMRLELNGN